MATDNEISHRSGSRKSRGATIGSAAPNQRGISLLALGLLIAGYAALFSASLSCAAEPDLKPGDTIGPQNWERVKGMVGENLLNRIKRGYSFQIKNDRSIGPPREFVAATAKYAGQVKLGLQG